MRVKVMLGLLSCGAFAALFACGGSHERAQAAATKAPIGAGDVAKANAQLARAVRDKLDSDEQLRAAALDIEADVTRNAVTLRGAVESAALRDKAIDLAKSAHAGVVVEDQIRVAANPSG